MSKVETEERIERSYRRWVIFTYVWRVFCVAYEVFILVAVLLGGPAYMLFYLLFPLVWWALSVSWLQNLRSIRDSRLETLQIRQDFYQRYGVQLNGSSSKP